MTRTCMATLLQFEPVVEGQMVFTWCEDGWTLRVRHRHCAARFGACQDDIYPSLSLGELQDLLPAVVDAWGPFGSPGADAGGMGAGAGR